MENPQGKQKENEERSKRNMHSAALKVVALVTGEGEGLQTMKPDPFLSVAN